jgi:hypothetical protein
MASTLLFLYAYIIKSNNVNLCKRSVFWNLCKYFHVPLYNPEQDVIRSSCLLFVTFQPILNRAKTLTLM